MSRAFAFACLALLALTGCAPRSSPRAPAASPPLSTATNLAPRAAEAAMQQQLASLGFAVAVDPGGVIRAEIAEGAPPEWFVCERVVVEDNDSFVKRSRWASPETFRIWLQVLVAEAAGGTSVTLQPYYEGIYLNRFNYLNFREECVSSGQLEPLLLSAVGRA